MVDLVGSRSGEARFDDLQRLGWLIAIADPVRLQILRSLSVVTEATATELASCSQTSHQTLRRHLEALQSCGVVLMRPGCSDGRTTGRPPARFSLVPDLRGSVCAVLGDAAALRVGA